MPGVVCGLFGRGVHVGGLDSVESRATRLAATAPEAFQRALLIESLGRAKVIYRSVHSPSCTSSKHHVVAVAPAVGRERPLVVPGERPHAAGPSSTRVTVPKPGSSTLDATTTTSDCTMKGTVLRLSATVGTCLWPQNVVSNGCFGVGVPTTDRWRCGICQDR